MTRLPPIPLLLHPPGVTLDARRAVFLHATETLAVADLHLGYAWAHRHGGQLLPVSMEEDSLPRLLDLVESHGARELVLLGDIVHRAVRVAELKRELCAVIETLRRRVNLVLVAGNHDRQLQRLLAECGVEACLQTSHEAGGWRLTHGDSADAPVEGVRSIVGHEHPAITISDGVATSVKCPCFALGEKVIMLPAFSRWAAGADLRTYARRSPWLRGEESITAVAIISGRLLPVRLRV